MHIYQEKHSLAKKLRDTTVPIKLLVRNTAQELCYLDIETITNIFNVWGGYSEEKFCSYHLMAKLFKSIKLNYPVLFLVCHTPIATIGSNLFICL
jgi:hypothetical protein